MLGKLHDSEREIAKSTIESALMEFNGLDFILQDPFISSHVLKETALYWPFLKVAVSHYSPQIVLMKVVVVVLAYDRRSKMQ